MFASVSVEKNTGATFTGITPGEWSTRKVKVLMVVKLPRPMRPSHVLIFVPAVNDDAVRFCNPQRQ